jgi:cell division septation protein DedD
MKKIDGKVILLLGIIVSVAIGFLYGTGLLGGSSADPGSREDPLLTAGYADAALEQRVREMDARIVTLEAKVQSLEGELAILDGGDAAGQEASGSAGAAAGGGASGTGTGGTGGTGSTGGTDDDNASQANIGKTGNVTSNPVNLREAASTSSNIKKKLTPSDTFTITKADKGWYQVQLSDGTVGWVAGYLVKVR